MGKDVIIACDFAGASETFAFLDLFKEEKPYVKIGMELFTRRDRRLSAKSRKEVIKSSSI